MQFPQRLAAVTVASFVRPAAWRVGATASLCADRAFEGTSGSPASCSYARLTHTDRSESVPISPGGDEAYLKRNSAAERSSRVSGPQVHVKLQEEPEYDA